MYIHLSTGKPKSVTRCIWFYTGKWALNTPRCLSYCQPFAHDGNFLFSLQARKCKNLFIQLPLNMNCCKGFLNMIWRISNKCKRVQSSLIAMSCRDRCIPLSSSQMFEWAHVLNDRIKLVASLIFAWSFFLRRQGKVRTVSMCRAAYSCMFDTETFPKTMTYERRPNNTKRFSKNFTWDLQKHVTFRRHQ